MKLNFFKLYFACLCNYKAVGYPRKDFQGEKYRHTLELLWVLLQTIVSSEIHNKVLLNFVLVDGWPPIKKKLQHLLSSIKQSIMKQGMPVTQAYSDGVFSRIE